MPYKVVKQNCTRSDGKKGKYVLKYKPKSKTKKKKDSQGFVKAGCHTSKKNASGQRAAIEGGPRETHNRGKTMRITKGKLKQIIREEYVRLVKQGLIAEAGHMGGRINVDDPEEFNDAIELLQSFLRVNPYWMGGQDDENIEYMAMSVSGMDGMGNALPHFAQFGSLEEVEEELHWFGRLANAIKHVRNEDLAARTGDGTQTNMAFEDIIREFGLSEYELEAIGRRLKKKFRTGEPRRHRTMGPVFG